MRQWKHACPHGKQKVAALGCSHAIHCRFVFDHEHFVELAFQASLDHLCLVLAKVLGQQKGTEVCL
jgi:hypothetical protein